MRIIKVHRAGRVWYTATVSGVYLERASLAELLEAIKVREGFARIFAEPVDTAS
jgi:hypothetical protein